MELAAVATVANVNQRPNSHKVRLCSPRTAVSAAIRAAISSIKFEQTLPTALCLPALCHLPTAFKASPTKRRTVDTATAPWDCAPIAHLVVLTLLTHAATTRTSTSVVPESRYPPFSLP